MKKEPEILNALEELLQDACAGDPMTGLKWTRKTLRALQRELKRQGFKVAIATIRRLLRKLRYANGQVIFEQILSLLALLERLVEHTQTEDAPLQPLSGRPDYCLI